MKISHVLIIIMLAISSVSIAQRVNTYGVLPTYNIKTKLPKDWSANLKIESRQELFQENWDYSYQLTEVSLGAAKKIGSKTKVAAGYLISMDNESTDHRLFQQFCYTKKYHSFRLSHRFQTDQTFVKNSSNKYRLRYKISGEIPLSGISIDPKEFYLKIGNEYLNRLKDKEYDLEIRTSGFVGFTASPKYKIELGIDYRLDSFIHEDPRNRYWLGINFYQSI